MNDNRTPAPLSLNLDPAALKPLIEQVVSQAIARLEETRVTLPDAGRLAYSEAEAAALLGLHRHQLRDERRRGRISAAIGPGRRILYSRADLMDYLIRRRSVGEN